MTKTLRVAALLSLVFLISAMSAEASSVVLKGSDYLRTLPDTTFGGVFFNGVPVGPGNTDTIVRRLLDADVTSGSASIPIELAALQLVSATPVDFGLGLDFYFITLQSVRGGPSSVGQMTINFGGIDDQLPNTPEGTFNSFFDVFFDVRKGALNGPIALSDGLILSNIGTFWDSDPGPGDLIVPGLVGDPAANLHTNKTRTSQMDFFPIGPFTETFPTGAVHIVTTATAVPEPSSLLLLGTCLAGLVVAGGFHSRRIARHTISERSN